MAAQLNENTQYIDPATGELLSNGLVYIGENNLDAELNLITIYADVGLTTTLLNPQRIGSDGRVSNKIFIPGKYSLKVKDANNNQKLNDLSVGEAETISNTPLINIQGSNDIIADASPSIVSLVDGQTYIFTTVAANTGAMTLTIDSTPTYPIKKYHNIDFSSGDFDDHQILSVIFNDTDNVFELVGNMSKLSSIGIDDNATSTAITIASNGDISTSNNIACGGNLSVASFFTSRGIDDNATSTRLTIADASSILTGALEVIFSDSGATASVENAHALTPFGVKILFSAAAPDDNTQWFLRCQDNIANRAFIYSDGDVWTSDAGTLTSDETLKTNIQDATPKLADLLKLQVRNFEWKESYHPNKVGKKNIGFIAQEVKDIFPSLISEHDIAPDNATYDDEGNELTPHVPDMRKAIKDVFSPMIVKALQEMYEEFDARLKALETR